MAASGAAGKIRSGFGGCWRAIGTRTKLLVLVCAGLNLLEAALVAAFSNGAHPDLAPQASAIAPLGVFGDLRWVSVYQDSWAAAAAEVAGVVVFRGAITAVSIVLAWPTGLAAPAWWPSMRRGAGATLLATVLLAPSVTLLFGEAVVPVSWLYLAAVPTALLVAVAVHPAAMRADWWRRLVTLRAAGWVVLAFAVLSLASAAMAALPAVFWPFVAVLSGVFNARCWTGLVRAVVLRPAHWHLVPVGGLLPLLVAGSVVGGTVTGFTISGEAAAHDAPKGYHTVAAAPPLTRASLSGLLPAVLVVSGYGSQWDGGAGLPLPANFAGERFSYRGLGPGGRPLPYTSADTAKPLIVLDRMLLAEVASLHELSGRPVAVVAESEGALIAKSALLGDPRAGVEDLVMASPLQGPGRVWYPTKGNQGWGVASNEAMLLMGAAFQGVAPVELSPDNAFLASLDDRAPLLENAMSCPLVGVHQVALLPLADATVAEPAEKLPFPSVVLPGFHGGLLSTALGEKTVAEFLEDRPVSSAPLLAIADKVISYAATAWQVPSLAASDYPDGGRQAPSGAPSCGEASANLHAAIFAKGPVPPSSEVANAPRRPPGAVAHL